VRVAITVPLGAVAPVGPVPSWQVTCESVGVATTSARAKIKAGSLPSPGVETLIAVTPVAPVTNSDVIEGLPPAGPVGPVAPVAPVGPVGDPPVLPVAPVIPVLPVGPVGPVGAIPVAPRLP
jgi:hypothetical protein